MHIYRSFYTSFPFHQLLQHLLVFVLATVLEEQLLLLWMNRWFNFILWVKTSRLSDRYNLSFKCPFWESSVHLYEYLFPASNHDAYLGHKWQNSARWLMLFNWVWYNFKREEVGTCCKKQLDSSNTTWINPFTNFETHLAFSLSNV